MERSELDIKSNMKAVKPIYYCPLCLTDLIRNKLEYDRELRLACQNIDCRVINVEIRGKLIK